MFTFTYTTVYLIIIIKDIVLVFGTVTRIPARLRFESEHKTQVKDLAGELEKHPDLMEQIVGLV